MVIERKRGPAQFIAKIGPDMKQAEIVLKKGYKKCELFTDFKHLEDMKQTKGKLEKIGELGIEFVSVHAPPSSWDVENPEFWVKKSLELANFVGCDIVVVHEFRPPKCKTPESCIRRDVKLLKACRKDCQKYKIKLTIETGLMRADPESKLIAVLSYPDNLQFSCLNMQGHKALQGLS